MAYRVSMYKHSVFNLVVLFVLFFLCSSLKWLASSMERSLISLKMDWVIILNPHNVQNMSKSSSS